VSKEIKAVPAIIKRGNGQVNEAGEPVMSVTFYVHLSNLEAFLNVGQRECTITIPEAVADTRHITSGWD